MYVLTCLRDIPAVHVCKVRHLLHHVRGSDPGVWGCTRHIGRHVRDVSATLAGFTAACYPIILTLSLTQLYVSCGLHAPCVHDERCNEVIFTGIIGARSSAVLTDMVVLGITICKARPVRVQGVKVSLKSTMMSILMRDGVYCMRPCFIPLVILFLIGRVPWRALRRTILWVSL